MHDIAYVIVLYSLSQPTPSPAFDCYFPFYSFLIFFPQEDVNFLKTKTVCSTSIHV